jgi:hypothetical protein
MTQDNNFSAGNQQVCYYRLLLTTSRVHLTLGSNSCMVTVIVKIVINSTGCLN